MGLDSVEYTASFYQSAGYMHGLMRKGDRS